MQPIDPASVPPGGKLLKCTACRRLVKIPLSSVKSAAAAAAADAKAAAAPKAKAPSASKPETPTPSNLPAPVGASARGVTGLPAPVGASARGVTDLPAPVGASARGVTDLPAPVGASARGVTDLPAPVGASARGVTDLPAPVGASARGVTDLPAPVGASARGVTGLPAPARPSGGVTGLPAPVGDDGVLDLLTPLDDSQISNRKVTVAKPLAPVGSRSGSNELAPRGFFDDIPMPAGQKASKSTDLPAPRGFFDDIPMPAGQARPLEEPSAGLLTPKRPSRPALDPSGAATGPAGGIAPRAGLGLELGAPGTAEHEAHDILDVPELELGSPGIQDFGLAGNPAAPGPSLELELDLPGSGKLPVPPPNLPAAAPGMNLELGLPGHELDVPDASPDASQSPGLALELDAPGTDAGLDIGLALDPLPDAGADSGLALELDGPGVGDSPGLALDPGGLGLTLDPLPGAGDGNALDLPLAASDASFGLSLEESGVGLQLDPLEVPSAAPDLGLALDPVGPDTANPEDDILDFGQALESGLQIADTDFSSYTNPGTASPNLADLPAADAAPALEGLSLDLPEAEPARSPGPAPGGGDNPLDMALELGFEPPSSRARAAPPSGATNSAAEPTATGLPEISLPDLRGTAPSPTGPALPEISLPGQEDGDSLSLADGLDFGLAQKDDAADQPLLDIGLATPSTGRAGSESDGPGLELAAGSLQSGQGPRTARADQAARMERALEDDEEALPSLALDQAVVDENAKQRAMSNPGLAIPLEESTETQAAKKPNRRRLILAAVAIVGVAALGVGGFMGYNYFKGKKEQSAAVAKEYQAALQQMHAGEPGHWERAGQAAERALTHDEGHADSLGLAAQAYLAAYLDEGTKGAARVQKGRQLIGSINQHSARGVQVDKARALLELIELRPERALPPLEGAVRKASTPDPDALLYLGWALADANKPKRAEQTFAKALAAAPSRPSPAMYGLALAQLALGKRKNALNNFEAILENDPKHLGARIGRAQAVEVEQFSERERMYLDIARGDDLEGAAPGLVAKAWSLAGTQALEAGRLDDARERFEKALEVTKRSVSANLGLAKVALGQGKLEDVRTALDAILKNRPSHLEAQLLLAELSVKEGKMEDAQQHVGKLLKNEPKLENKLDRARIHSLNGQILRARAEASKDEDRAGLLKQSIEAYEKARELAGETDVGIALALAELLGQSERAEEAAAILAPLEDKATTDSRLATTLGLLYAKAEDPAKAETWFRKAVELNPKDTESRFQLGLALDALGRVDEALPELEAAFRADKSRTDIGAELATIYEAKNRDKEASALYEELLQQENRTVVLLMRAGVFFVRAGTPNRAKKLADEILEAEKDNPVGLYVSGESLYYDSDYKNALRRFRDAVNADPKPHYLDGQGRAAEMLSYHDEALGAFQKASKSDPNFKDPLIGEARVLIQIKSYDKARTALEKVLERWPRNPDAFHHLGVIERRNNELKKAVDYFERALRYDRERADSYHELGQAYFDLDKQRRAAKALTLATRLAKPDTPWLTQAYLNLGYAEYSRSNRRQAIDAWEAYLARNPSSQAQVNEVKKLLLRLKAR